MCAGGPEEGCGLVVVAGGAVEALVKSWWPRAPTGGDLDLHQGCHFQVKIVSGMAAFECAERWVTLTVTSAWPVSLQIGAAQMEWC